MAETIGGIFTASDDVGTSIGIDCISFPDMSFDPSLSELPLLIQVL